MQLLPLVRRLTIVTKEGELLRFEPNWAQLQLLFTVERLVNEGKPVRIIVLKARQLGISTMVEALLFLAAFIYDRFKALVVAHDQDSGQHLLSMTENYWETYPFKPLYNTRYQSRNELAWVETHSAMKVQTAKNTKAGRSRTLHGLHASEVAFWDTPSTTMLGLRQSIPTAPGTFVFVESTANGVGNWFHQQWRLAEEGESGYVPLFFPWHQHPEYTASAIGLPPANLGNLDSEERALRQMGIGDDRLQWRRYAIKNLTNNDVNQFHQEYPTTPEEAFIASGTNVFPLPKLREVYQPMQGEVGRLVREGSQVRFQPDISGPLRIFRFPSSDREYGKYFVAGDPTHTTRGDYACAQVINRRTLEQVAVLRLKTDPASFAEDLAKLGRYYNDAVLSSEIEGPGYATIGALLEMNYPYIWQRKWADKTPGKAIPDTYGWSSTMKSKQLCVGMLLKLVVDADITIHDRMTFKEMEDFVTLDDGGFGNAAKDGHDDTVMALAICVTCHMTDSPLIPYGMGGDNVPEETWQAWGEEPA